MESAGDVGGDGVCGQDFASLYVSSFSSSSLGGAIWLTLCAGNPEKPHVKFSTELKGHQASVEKVAFNPTKDAELCSVSADGVVKFWDVRTKECFNEVKGLGDALSLVWAPDGETLIVGNKVNSFFFLALAP